MRLLGMSDLHLAGKNPQSRIDNYHETQFNKVKYILDWALDNFIDLICFGGDIFHSHDAPYWLIEKYIGLFGMHSSITSIPIFVVFGQHDMRYHSSERKNTPLGVLLAAVSNMKLLGPEPYEFRGTKQKDVAHLYGCSYGDEIPEPTTNGKNILVIHDMIVDKKLWEDQDDFMYAKDLLKETDYDLIISGDNHKTHSLQKGRRALINSGSLMRMASDQLEHVPSFFTWESREREVTKHTIPIVPSEEVFDLKRLEVVKDRDEKLDAFINGLTTHTGDRSSTSFVSNVHAFIKKNNLPEGVVKVIKEVMADD